MTAVADYHITQFLFMPVFKKPVKVVFCFLPVPAIKGLVHHQKAHLITHIQ